MAQPTGAVLVVIPTYDERDNLRPLLARLHRSVPGAAVLVVDDASPDGTGELAEELAAQDPRIAVLHREAKSGLGTAYLAGFAWAMERDHQVVVQMDADGSHPPEALPAMLAALEDADLVMGSRYVPGGEVRNWPVHREWLSRSANLYSRIALGVPTRDVTAGYRAFRRQVLAELDLDSVASQGYCFQIDMTWRALQAGFRVVEVPITFTERERGKSKMSGAIVAEALWQVARWGTWRLLRRPGPGTRSAIAAAAAAEPQEAAPAPEPAAEPTPTTTATTTATKTTPKAAPKAAAKKATPKKATPKAAAKTAPKSAAKAAPKNAPKNASKTEAAPTATVPVDDDAVSDGPVRA